MNGSRRRLSAAFLGALLLAPSAHAGDFRAGFGRAVITPETPDTWTDVDGDGRFDPALDRWSDGNGNGRFDAVWMAGFQQGRPAAGAHDDLLAVAAVFDDGVTRVGLVAADVVGLSHGFVRALRGAVPASLGIDYLLVHATHNHQGPDTQGLWGESLFSGGRDDAYQAFLRDRMVDAVGSAVSALEPARLVAGHLPGRFATVDTRPPEVLDDGARVVVVRAAKGERVLGTLLNFGNHVELLWDRNIELTADVAGYARRALETGLEGDGALFREGLGGQALWLTGNIGGLVTTLPEIAVPDVRGGPPVREPSFAKARAQGYALATAVLDAAESGALGAVASPTIVVHRREIVVPLQNLPLVLASWLGVLDRRIDFGWGFETASEVALVRIGDVWITAVPGELYPEIAVGGIESPEGADYPGLAPVEVPPLRSAMGGRVNLMVNLANDALGYLIPRSEWDREAPWLYGAEEETYGEVVSAGPDAAAVVHGALLGLLREAAGTP